MKVTLVSSMGYEEQLQAKSAFVAELFKPLVDHGLDEHLLVLPGMEVRPSPARHFRARTVVPVGADTDPDAPNLFRFVVEDSGRLRFAAAMPAETLLLPIASALPLLAELLSGRSGVDLRPGLRCVKFHASMGGDPPEMLVCLIYGPEAEVPLEEALNALRDSLSHGLRSAAVAVDVAVMAQAHGVQRCVPQGRDFVEERLSIASHDAPLKYRQPFGQFSNPNPHIAIATAEWLLDVIRTDVKSADDAAEADLLELYCGAGSHTVALASMFRHVLAVEINRHLVTAAEFNMSQNGLTNVTVIRAPSEEFCKRVLKRRSYQIRRPDGTTQLQLNFGCTIVDPPRAGLDEISREAVSGYGHVLYVSCNPEALHRDLSAFLGTHEVRRLVLLDHFPFSGHVEVGAYLQRRGRDHG